MKCTSCSHRWLAKRETGDFTSTDPEPETLAHPGDAAPEDADVYAEAPADEALSDDDLEIVAVEPEFPRPRAARAPAPARNPKGEARGKVAVWVSAAALVVALVAGAIVFRGEVVKFVPKSQAAYAGLGLPVNSVGLVIEGVQATPTFLAGRPVLSVTGDIRNVREAAVNSPALRVNLLNRQGKPIAAKIVRPIDPKVPAGATRHFAIAISDPPSNAHDLEVRFETGGERTATTPITAAAPPAPVEAQPIPAGSPDALAEHG